MPGEGPPLPNRFPCLCKAIYSWGGETKRDLGFVEGDLIECLNAGDGQWWMGRLRRNKQVGLFPSNFVEVLDDPIPPSRPVSRNGVSSPTPHGGNVSRAVSPSPSVYSRAASPQPPIHQYLDRGRSPSPNPYQHQQSYSRANSPNPYPRAASPNPYRAVSPDPYQRHSRAPSPNPYQRAASPNPYRTVSPAPGSYNSRAPPANYQRAASPNPHIGHSHVQDDIPPPAPPPHRYQRASSPSPPRDGRRTPAVDRAHSPGLLGNTPSPLRNAMEDVMESLEHMASHDERPRTPHHDPWSPEAFADQFHPSPKRRSYIRPETSLGIGDRNSYPDEDDENEGMAYPDKPRRPASRVEDRTRRFQSSDRYGVDDDGVPPAPPPKNPSYSETARPRTGDATIQNRKSMYDVGSKSPSPSKLFRPRPLSRNTTIKSTTTSNQSSSTNTTTSTAATSASIMSGISAGGFSATSAGSLARRKLKAMSVIEGHGQRFSLSNFGRTETPSPSPGIRPANGGAPNVLRRGQTWAASEAVPSGGAGVFGGLTAPKPKKTGFLKKILNSAKTSTASARSVANSPTPFSIPKTIPDGINSIAGGKAVAQQQSQDWVQVRRDVNRSNTFSRNERIERQERQQLMDQVVLRPVDALDDDVDGDEAADGGIVQRPANFDAANLSLVDKSARFIGNPPPFTTPESLANHHVCRPYRSDVQRLRAIFTWVSEKIAWEHPSGPLNGEMMGGELDTRTVIAQKRGSPEEVAAVVLGMCNAVGISCEIIRGYLKAPGEVLDVDMCPRPNHWWNAVIVDGEWRFMDCSLASPTHPRRVMYSSSPLGQADFFWFLTKPSQFCWTHIPIMMEQQHLVPALPMPYLLALPCACPPFFKHGLQMINFDTSLTRIEDLEVAQVEFSVPVDIECFAEVEVRGFATDQDGDIYDTGDVVKKRALCQVAWENRIKTYRVKAVLPGDEGQGVLKIYAGKRGLIHSIKDNPHPLALALPIIHTGENPPYDFLVRHPTPHAQRHDLYVSQPQCSKLAVNNTFVFAVRQHPSDGSPDSPSSASGNAPKPAKLAIQTPSGKILRLMKKPDSTGTDNGMVWETIIKCGERGSWRALVLADRSARWCVYAEWNVV